MFCPKCGGAVSDNAKFCSNCAFRLDPQPRPQAVIPDTPAVSSEPVRRAPEPAPMPQMYASAPAGAAVSGKSHKKLIILLISLFAVIGIVASLLIIFVFGGDKIVGKWHCVNYKLGNQSYNNEQFKQATGYGFASILTAEFTSDGKGKVYLMGLDVNFEWKANKDKYDLDVDNPVIKNGTVEFSGDQLVISFVNENAAMECRFEKGEVEADPEAQAMLKSSADAYVTKSKLRTANVNAKLVYTSVASACADLVADGKSDLIGSGVFGPVKISDLDDDDIIQKAVKAALTDNGISGESYISWSIGSRFRPDWTQWSESDDGGMVGQYPDPETDAAAEHTIGSKY